MILADSNLSFKRYAGVSTLTIRGAASSCSKEKKVSLSKCSVKINCKNMSQIFQKLCCKHVVMIKGYVYGLMEFMQFSLSLLSHISPLQWWELKIVILSTFQSNLK